MLFEGKEIAGAKPTARRRQRHPPIARGRRVFGVRSREISNLGAYLPDDRAEISQAATGSTEEFRAWPNAGGKPQVRASGGEQQIAGDRPGADVAARA